MDKEKVKILLVEDNYPDTKLMELYLKESYGNDFDLTSTERLSEAVEKSLTILFDVIILDLTLPDSTGIDTFRVMNDNSRGTPIIVLTGLSDELFGLDAVKLGAEDFLSKNTINAHILKRALNYGIERHKLQKKLAEQSSKLSQSEKTLKEAQEMGQMGSWSCNADLKQFEFSDELYRIFGLLPQSAEIKADWFWKHIHPDEVEELRHFLIRSTESILEEDIYFKIIRPDLSIKNIYTRVKPVLDASGKCIKLQGISQDVTDRIFQEKKYSFLMDAGPDGIIVTDNNLKIVEWNNNASRILGWKEEEVKSRYLLNVIAKQDEDVASGLVDSFTELTEEKVIKFQEFQALRMDGTFFPAEISITLLRLESKFIYICYLRDVSYRKQIETELDEKEELYKTVIESLNEGLIISDIDNRIIYSNSRMEELSGFSSSELEGGLLKTIFANPEWKQEKWSTEEDQFKSFSTLLKKKNTERFWAQINLSPFKNSENEIIGSVAAIADITSEKREKELEDLVIAGTKSINSVIITDSKGKIEWVNDGFSNKLNYHLEEVKGKTLSFLNKNDHKRLSNFKLVYTDKKPLSYETKKISKDGKHYWFISTLTPVLDDDGQVNRIIAIDTDITQRKEIEKQLKISKRVTEHSFHRAKIAIEEMKKAKLQVEKTIKAKEMFMANMSHEIRTPMNGIIGLTEVLLKSENDKEKKEYLRAIKSSGDTLMVVINDVLDVSKIDAGKMTFEQIPFNLTQILETVNDLFTPKILEKQIKMNYCVGENIPDTLIGDPSRLNQIIMNLVSNAVKFTSRGEVQFGVELKDQDDTTCEILLFVKDTGRGIPEDKFSSIFMDFTQVTPEIARKFGGTGLGLAITKRLVELQGGNIKVKSELKKGTEFIVTMKFQKCLDEDLRCQAPVDSNRQEEVRNLNGLKILLAEDNPINQMLAVKILKDWGAQVDVAENGREAIEKLKKNQDYKLVLMDIKMPEMDGYQATNYIRENLTSPLNKIPVIAQTAHAATWEVDKCIQAGMNDYISKPFNLDELFDKIVKAVEEKNEPVSDLEHPKNIESSPSFKTIDLTYLNNIAQGNDEFLLQVIESFIDLSKKEVENLSKEIEGKNWDGIYHIAHKLKASTKYVGDDKGVEILEKIEKNAKAKIGLEEVSALLKLLTENYEDAALELKEYIEQFTLH